MMCALCGVLRRRASHWTDAAARPGVFTRNVDPLQRRRERSASRRLRQPGAGLLRADAQRLAGAASFILSTATGKTELVDDLGHLWAAAERLLGRPCDPLDPDLIDPAGGGRVPEPRSSRRST